MPRKTYKTTSKQRKYMQEYYVKNKERVKLTKDKWYQKNKKKLKKYCKKKRSTIEGRIQIMFYEARKKTKSTDITKSWIESRVRVGFCELTGIPFDYSKHGGKALKGPSIDRINSKRGYYKENCQIILTWLNIAKSNMEIDKFKELLHEASLNWKDKVEIAA